MTLPTHLNIDTIFEDCGERAEANGWRADMPNKDTHHAEYNAWIASKLMLSVGELSEALEELRNGHAPTEIYFGPDGKPEGFLVEVSDCIIRLGDLWHAIAQVAVEDTDETEMIRPSEVIYMKTAYNDTRGHRHGGKAL